MSDPRRWPPHQPPEDNKDQRRPSPVQPPVNHDPNSMARVQVQPGLPAPSFLGRPEPRQTLYTQGPRLPSISSLLNQPGPPAVERPKAYTPPKHWLSHIVNEAPPTRPEGVPPPPVAPQYHSQHAYDVPWSAYPTAFTQPTCGPPPPHQSFEPSIRYSQIQRPAPFRDLALHNDTRSIQSPNGTSRESSRLSSPASTLNTVSPSLHEPPGAPFSHRKAVQALPYDFTLSIRQQPVAARACGFGERDRRVIDPPPILELKITDRETGAPEQDHNSLLALHCTLMTPDGSKDDTEAQSPDATIQAQRRLMGTLVASPYPAKDEHGIAGTFFVFPDLSCRSPGQYALRFKLIRIDPMNMVPGTSSPCVASALTDAFNVYTAKDFPGMKASSPLLVALRRQGLNVGVKKGSEARKGKGKTKKESSSSDEDEDSNADSEDERRGSRGTAGSASAGDVSPKTRTALKKKTKRKRRES